MSDDTQTSTAVTLAVVLLLGAIALSGVGGVIWLLSVSRDATVLVALIGPPIGALGALLASTRSVSPGGVRAEALADVALLTPEE